jgi:thymidylate synthase (FAD)
VQDPWKELRTKCFGNEEPTVELVAYSLPIGKYKNRSVEELPAISAAVSYGSSIDTIDQSRKLNHQLIHKQHLTPLEACQFNFYVKGISKICGAQLSRHRIGQGHVSSSRRFRRQEMSFVYPMLNYLTDEREVKQIYELMSLSNQHAFEQYLVLKGRHTGIKKSDARYIIPASTATMRHWWVNARSLTNFFRLRLAPDAEWEIRRLAEMILVIVNEITPSLFSDIAGEFKCAS